MKSSTPGTLARALAIVAACVLAACATAPPLTPATRAELAPGGTLRAGINYGNVVLATKDPKTGELNGVHVDLARELARRAGVTIELIGYDSAGAMVDGLKRGALDVALLSAEPARASEITFSPAYVDIDATYLVPAGSQIRDVADIDRDGMRVAIAAKSAYEFFLSRNLKHAKLVAGPGTFGAYDVFVSGKLDALVGIRPRLVIESEKLPGSRVLAGASWRSSKPSRRPRPHCGRALRARLHRGRQSVGCGRAHARRTRGARCVGVAAGEKQLAMCRPSR
jgi:polar amino acid transport system substrate-binding protein